MFFAKINLALSLLLSPSKITRERLPKNYGHATTQNLGLALCKSLHVSTVDTFPTPTFRFGAIRLPLGFPGG
ncbi:hypothetical protein MPNT_480003 [Candidatus Methylacidithermus pantelleriae]|uniref:Uncharacterized protein n=1 Tax=Candidatus Methylacidithermus pantelleriae TaxID=2744239 RepID=A0A8J2BNK9_9BACT|nr:hypothetical protein MPNT_480003 [Candidatus Methylacidithermus pantelleriae]